MGIFELVVIVIGLFGCFYVGLGDGLEVWGVGEVCNVFDCFEDFCELFEIFFGIVGVIDIVV